MDIDNSFEKTLNPCLKDAIAAYLEGEEKAKANIGYQLKDRHGLIALLVLSLAVYVQFPLLALDFRHGVQNEFSSQRKGGNKHERHG